MQITLKLYLQSENCNVNLESHANTNKKEDKNTNLSSSKGIEDIDEVERLEIIEKRT